MNPEITREQQDQLGNWSRQRDDLLLEISNLRDEKFSLEKGVEEANKSQTDISESIKVSEGRLLELDKKEKKSLLKVNKELSDAEKQKAVVESQIAPLEKVVELLTKQKNVLIEVNNTLTTANEGILAKTAKLDTDIGKITAISTENSNELLTLMETLKTSVGTLVKTNQENVEETNYIIGELPRLFFDLQREVLEKRVRIGKKITKQ